MTKSKDFGRFFLVGSDSECFKTYSKPIISRSKKFSRVIFFWGFAVFRPIWPNVTRSAQLVEKCPNCLKRPTYSRPPWSVWITQKCPKVSNVPTYALNFENCQKVYKVAQKSAKSAPKRPKVSKGPNSAQKCPSCPQTWKVIKIVQFPRLFRSGQTAQKCWNRHKI